MTPPMSTPGVVLAAPGYTLGTANTKGAATTVAPTDSTLLAFDATVPPAETNPATAAAGAAAVAARRDHLHAVASPATPTTQASGDAATSGAGTGFATDTHKHGFPTLAAVQAVVPALVPFWGQAPGAVVAAPSTLTANRAYLVPLPPVAIATAITAVLFQVGIQSGNVDVGLYSTTDWATFTRVASSGSTACPAAAFRNAIALSATLQPGTQYLLAFAADNGVATIGGWSADNGTGILLSEVAYIKATSFPLPTSLTGMSDVAANTTIPLLMGSVTGGQGI